jgi:HK97 family phage major capsid protein
MTTTAPLESARTQLTLAQHTFAEQLPALNARLDAAQSVAEVEAVEREISTAEAPVLVARKRLESAERIEEARSNTSHLIPKSDAEGRGRISVLSEPTTYSKDNFQTSFFSDLYAYQRGRDAGAAERLERNSKESRVLAEERGTPFRDTEGRAMGSNTGSGGDFLPPLYFGDLYAEFKRARRVTADLVRNLPLAAKGNTITVPRFTGGALTGAQQDNQNVTTQDASTAIITIPVCTVAGYNDLSRQIVERSDPGLDQLILEDLLKDYNKRVNTFVLNGSGSSGQPRGILTAAYNSVSFNSGTPTVATLYPKLLDALRQIQENVFETPTAWVMTARRWAWILNAVDSTGRPLVVPNSQGNFNAMGVLAEGPAGPFGNDNQKIAAAGTLLGLPVYVDETVSKVLGTGTNQDEILVAAWDEHILWEDPQGPRRFVFEGVTSQTAAIRVQVFGYCAFTSERFTTATSVITGTGLQAPVF